MNSDLVWVLLYTCLFIALCTGACIWFLLPKKWIVWTEVAIKIMPKDVVPPWAALNSFGKTLYLLFILSVSLMFVLLLVYALKA